MSEASSVELRAERSSSCGSMPRRADERVGRAVEHPDRPRASTAVKPRWKRWVARATAIGLASARFLGTSSPKIIVAMVPSVSPMPTAIGVTAPSGHAEAVERPVDQLGDRGLGQEADRQVGDRDADLGAGELGREAAQCLLQPLRRGVTSGGRPLDLAAVDGDEGELGRDEHAAGEDEEQRCDQQQPRCHRCSPCG